MARARNIKPGFYKNEDLAECSVWARLLFPGLWMLADREGRMEDRPKRIKGEVFPFDSIEVEPLLAELERWKFIIRYEVGGVRYIQITNFSKHQKPHSREKASDIPCPSGYEAPPSDGADTEEDETKHDLGNAEAQPRQCPARPDSLIPDSLIPESGTPLPSVVVTPPAELLPAVADATAPEKKPVADTALQAACRETWKAYGDAYTLRYGVAPVRNAKVSGQVKQLVQRIGADEAPMVAAWFIGHPNGFYVTKGHDIGCLLSDAEKLRTEWATGRVMTAGKARQSDRAGTTMAALAEVLAEQGEMS